MVLLKMDCEITGTTAATMRDRLEASSLASEFGT